MLFQHSSDTIAHATLFIYLRKTKKAMNFVPHDVQTPACHICKPLLLKGHAVLCNVVSNETGKIDCLHLFVPCGVCNIRATSKSHCVQRMHSTGNDNRYKDLAHTSGVISGDVEKMGGKDVFRAIGL